MIAIVAITQDYGIGFSGQMLRPISADLKRFKAITMGKIMIYGSKTLQTFPKGQVLPGRLNLLLSRKLKASEVPGAEIYPSIEALLERVEELKTTGRTEDDFCVIGGDSVYHAFLPYTHEVNLTRIDAIYPADTYFPNLEDEGFTCQEFSKWQWDKDIRYRYEIWRR